MRILFLNHPEQDYGEFFLFDGFCELFRDENVITFPWKKSYYGIVDNDYILDSGKRGNTGPCPYMKKRYVEAWSEDKIKSSLDEFGLWILASPRTYAINALRKFISFKKPNTPLVFCDHEDGMVIRGDLIREFKPNLVFKRELTKENNQVYPLPFSSICWHFQEDIKEKIIDVFCAFGLTHQIRKNIRNLLQGHKDLQKYKVVANVNDCGDAMFGYRDYLKMMASAKINIVARGHGLDTVRRFEMPTFSGLVLADKLPLITPNDYEDKKHVVYFKNDLSDLIDKIIYYLEHDEERKKIGEAGRKHTFMYHTSIRRVEYLLSFCNIRTS